MKLNTSRFGEFGIETIECGVPNDTIHAPNECCKMADVEDLSLVFREVIKQLSGF